MSELAGDAWQELSGYDGRIAATFRALLHPGRLTIDYLQGRRARYLPPVRLYLIASVVYFVLSAAAGLFVSPAPGPVLANYGLDTLRFVKPVGIGDTIQARLTCKRKIDRKRPGQGVVAWDVEVSNQHDELVASYDILTLVAKKE